MLNTVVNSARQYCKITYHIHNLVYGCKASPSIVFPHVPLKYEYSSLLLLGFDIWNAPAKNFFYCIFSRFTSIKQKTRDRNVNSVVHFVFVWDIHVGIIVVHFILWWIIITLQLIWFVFHQVDIWIKNFIVGLRV